MNKVFSFITLGLLVILMLGAVSASTLIAGKIYNADYTQTVAGADVIVLCNGNTKNATSLSDGAYSVTFSEDECEYEDTLTVSASHPSYGYGSQTGIIHDEAFGDWDLAIVNVPLVPEFGLIAGMVTILGAVGMFFFVRKK